MTMSSDKLASVKEPTVTLDFDVNESGKDRNVSVELSKEELDNLISSLDAANKVLWFKFFLHVHQENIGLIELFLHLKHDPDVFATNLIQMKLIVRNK